MHVIGFFCLCCHKDSKQTHAISHPLCNTNQQRSKAPRRLQQRQYILHDCTSPGTCNYSSLHRFLRTDNVVDSNNIVHCDDDTCVDADADVDVDNDEERFPAGKG